MKHSVIAGALGALLLVAGGCQDGLKIGQMTLIQPKTPLQATRVVLSRGQQKPTLTLVPFGSSDPVQGDVAPQAQVLAVQLDSGHGTFTTEDGRQYPVQLSPARLGEVRQLVSDRSWLIGNPNPQKKASSVTWYELAVYDGEHLVEREVAWPVPSAKELPASTATLMQTFTAADRMVHPLSLQVNLLK